MWGSVNNPNRRFVEGFTRQQVEALLAVPSKRSATGIRNYVMMFLMWKAGLRASEICNLKPGHIQWEQRQILVARGKGGKGRVVPVKESTLDRLRLWDHRRPASPWFFCTLKGGRLDESYLRHMMLRYGEAAGVPNAHPHRFRHTYALDLLRAGVDIVQVQHLLGHAHLATTLVYLFSLPIGLHEALEKVPEEVGDI